MKQTLLAGAALGALALSPAAAQTSAGGGFYLSLDDVDGYSAVFRGTHQFYRSVPFTFGGEAEVSLGVSGEEYSDSFGGYDIKPSLGAGAYGVATYTFPGTPYSIFGRAGVAYQGFDVDGTGIYGDYEYADDDIGLGYGAGLRYSFSELFALRADLTRSNEYDLLGVSLEYRLGR